MSNLCGHDKNSSGLDGIFVWSLVQNGGKVGVAPTSYLCTGLGLTPNVPVACAVHFQLKYRVKSNDTS